MRQYSRKLCNTCLALMICLIGSVSADNAVAQINFDIEEPPFEYSDSPGDNRVSRLIRQLESKEIELEYTREHGHLKSILKALEISETSQVLVFSKTSLQVKYISRRNPRAIYFNDDTYVGWVRGSSLMEISTADPHLGAAFYTVEMMPWRADVEQAYYDCLGCHATSMTRGVPGHTVRSVLPKIDGSVDSQMKSTITDHSSPLSQRWGGWYVTGRHGEMKHQGNAFLRSGSLDTRDNGNRLHLRDEFDTFDYLSPYSDIVALMVLDHQTQMHNVISLADFQVRKLQYDLRELDDSKAARKEFAAQVTLIGQDVVQHLLFCDEAALTGEVKGSVLYVNQFVRRGPKDELGRSLREFDLQERLFKYPCSFLLYSEAFDALQPVLRDEVLRQLHAVLVGEDRSEVYAHLDAGMRAAILQIIVSTKPGLPSEWNVETAPKDQPTETLNPSVP